MDMSVGEAIYILSNFMNHQYTALRIKGLDGKTYMIDGISINNDQQVVLHSKSLQEDLNTKKA